MLVGARWIGRWNPGRSRIYPWILLLFCSLLTLSGCKKQEPLPVLGQVGAFALIDQRGQAFTLANLSGKVWVASFFFTRCPTICPRITRRVQSLQVAAKARDLSLSEVSFSVDPENDTPPVLLKYAERYHADLGSWSFLTGDLEVVKRTVTDGFKLALEGKAAEDAENGGIIHGSHLVLVDRHAAIRGYYRSDDDGELKRLLDDAAGL
jgi:protein SCO1